MTIIEFFEHKSHVENIISTLLCAPDKVIFLGDNKKKIDKLTDKYREIAEKRGIKVVFDSRAINRNNLNSIIDTIESILETDSDCIIDLSGGDDLSLVASGVVYGEHADEVKLHRFNISNSKMIDCDSDGMLCNSAPLELTVEELVAINGGRVIYTTEKTNTTYRWDFNDEFVEDIHILWSLCKQDPSDWNDQIGFLVKLLTLHPSDGGLVTVNLPKAAAVIKEMKKDKELNIPLYKMLGKFGILTDFRVDANRMSFRFKNDQIQKCLSKAGQVLELYLAVSASELKDKDGNPYYTDVMTGVFIDWDGEIHPGTSKDVANEIDLILMKGLMPVFISCKNGAVPFTELFKLSVVADKFGGKYVRKVLAATEIDDDERIVESVKIRADAMDIKPWIKIHEQNDKEFDTDLRNLWATK